jgi:regulatory protein
MTARPPLDARQAALRLLGRRDYTAKELREKLEQRGHPRHDIDGALAGLAADGLQSDERAAAAYLRTASRVRGRGRLRIARELEARGVDRSIVQRLTADLGADDEAAAIASVLRRRRWPAEPTLAERRRMYRHLLGRGFSADAVARALRHREDE